MKYLIFTILFLATLVSNAQYRGTRQNAPLVRTEDYVTNSPGNSIANSKLVTYYKDSTAIGFGYPSFEFWSYKASRNDGVPTRVLWLDNNGFMKISPMPGYLLSESDPVWTSDKLNYYDKTTSDGRYLQNFIEVDPTVSSFVKSITAASFNNGNTAFSWGNHATAGYLATSLASSIYQPLIGYVPYNSSNPAGYISSFTEIDPIWNSDKTNYYTKSASDLRYLQSFTELDPNVPGYSKSLSSFSVVKTSTDALYYPLSSNPNSYLTGITSGQVTTALGFTPYSNTNPNGYISSFTESDPTVPSYSKSLSGFSVIKSSTDPLYRPIGYVPSWTDITSKPTTISGYGITDAVSTARNAISVTNVGTSGTATYSSTTGVINVPTHKSSVGYSGVTSGSGTYTVTFPVAYSSTPYVVANVVNGTVPYFCKVVRSMSGFTVTVNNMVSVLGLLPTFPVLNGVTVDVIVLEQ